MDETRDDLPRALVINLASRPDRWAAVCSAWRGILRLERLEAVVGARGGADGCMRSHLAAMARLRDTDADAILVLEDDAEPIARELPQLREALVSLGVVRAAAPTATQARLPPDWIVANLGPLVTWSPPGDAPTHRNVVHGTPFLALTSAVASHALVYHRRVLDVLPALALAHERGFQVADRWYSDAGRPRVLAPSTILVRQAVSRSDIANQGLDPRPRDYRVDFQRSARALEGAFSNERRMRRLLARAAARAAAP